jgi:uncharacterized protein (DUF433 family)
LGKGNRQTEGRFYDFLAEPPGATRYHEALRHFPLHLNWHGHARHNKLSLSERQFNAGDRVAAATSDLFTPAEAAAVAEVPLKAVYKTVSERLPKSSLVQRSGQTYLTAQAVICVRLDHDLPKEVPVKVRRFVFGKLKESSSNRVEYGTVLFNYVVDARPTAKMITERLQRYRKVMSLIVEDPEVQGGAATFKGTRLLVHHVAALLRQGVTEVELREDYPNLTQEMIGAAPIYVQARPRRGRPRKPSWRNTKPLGSKLMRRRDV